MKILFLTDNVKGTNGYSRYTLDLAREFVHLGHEVHAIVSDECMEENIIQHKLVEDPLKYLSNPLRVWKTSRLVKKCIRNISPDIVHVVAEPYATLFLFMQIPHSTKLVLTAHGTFVAPWRLLSGLQRILSRVLFYFAYKRVNSIICVSNYTKDELLKVSSHLSNKVRVVTNGTSISYVTNQGVDELEEKGSAIKKILFVGAVTPRKGVLEAVEGVGQYFTKYNKNIEFHIVGRYDESDPYYKKIQERVTALSLESVVNFLGRVSEDNLDELYHGADVFLMPAIREKGSNNFEGFGLVYLEANARGIATIGPNDTGAAEAISDGVSGYRIDPRSPDSVSEALYKILDEHSIKPVDCMEWAKKHSIEKKAREIEQIYTTIL
jgi:phosphatidyl-myo-inositol dimannoside synthase